VTSEEQNGDPGAAKPTRQGLRDLDRRPEKAVDRASPPDKAGLLLRFVSIIPFLLLSASGIAATIGWFLIIVVGGGTRDPIWVWAAGSSARVAVPQIAAAVGLGIFVFGVTMVSMWAALHGLDATAGKLFWRVAEVAFSLLAVPLVVAVATRPEFVTGLGISRGEWFLSFGFIGFSLSVFRLREWRSASV
jgi:hypothetical protein